MVHHINRSFKLGDWYWYWAEDPKHVFIGLSRWPTNPMRGIQTAPTWQLYKTAFSVNLKQQNWFVTRISSEVSRLVKVRQWLTKQRQRETGLATPLAACNHAGLINHQSVLPRPSQLDQQYSTGLLTELIKPTSSWSSVHYPLTHNSPNRRSPPSALNSTIWRGRFLNGPCELNDAPSSSAMMCEARRCLVHRQRPGNGTQP